MDCDIGSASATAGRMTKPKKFDKVISLRLLPGEWERIEELRGTERQGDFLRRILSEAMEAEQAKRPARRPPSP